MDYKKIQNKLDELEAFADLMKSHVTVLRKELEVSDASSSSARKGKPGLPESEIARILAKRQKTRMKKPALDEKTKAELLSKIQKRRIKR